MDRIGQATNNYLKALKDDGVLLSNLLADRHYYVGELKLFRLELSKMVMHTFYPLAFKTKRHFDGTMFNGDFLVGIYTPRGPVVFHFKMEYFDEFEVPEIECGPNFNEDKYTPIEALERLKSLPSIGNNYIDTGKGTILNPDSLISPVDLKSIDEESEHLEKKKALARNINEMLGILRDLNYIDLNNIVVDYHDFNLYYQQRRGLLNIICNNYVDLAYKSDCDINGVKIPGNKFLVGLKTLEGQVCFIINNEKGRYDEFKVSVLERAPIAQNKIYCRVMPKLASLPIRQMTEEDAYEKVLKPYYNQ
jgi:hypothetical protein